jgi:formylglycine-generating enzyme required for sulfatase activity
MVYVPAGGGLQGSEKGPSGSRPAHAVFLDAYYIDVHEVTVGQYENYRQAQRDAKKPVPVEPRHELTNDRAPVVGVNWRDAWLYSQWAGKELPTEAQWERAARGAEGFDHPWGNGVPIWTRPRTPTQLDAIGSFAGDRSPYGIFDLAGNAREWCSDWYSEGYYRELAEGKPAVVRNPTGPRTSRGTDLRVVKGGDADWKAWGRSGLDMTKRVGDVGFRCVLNPGRKGRKEPTESAESRKKAKPAKRRSP